LADYTYIQAKRALLCWVSGSKKTIHGPPGYFSKSNWGDRIERRNGEEVLVKRTSSLMKLAGKLTDVQWKKILDSASAEAKYKKFDSSNSLATVDDSSDFEIEDGNEDLIQVDDDTGAN
jgi:hypothetical protein